MIAGYVQPLIGVYVSVDLISIESMKPEVGNVYFTTPGQELSGPLHKPEKGLIHPLVVAK